MPRPARVVAQKRTPLLPSWLVCANRPHVLLNGALAHVDAQFQEFTPYAFSTPEPIVRRHLSDQAIVSAATFGSMRSRLDFRFQYKRKSSRCHLSSVSGCTMRSVCFQVRTILAKQHEEQAIGFRAGGPFHLPPEDDQLLAQEGIFGDELGLASVKIGEGCQRQGGPERFGPTSQTRGECIQAAILQPPEIGHHTSHTKSFSIT